MRLQIRWRALVSIVILGLLGGCSGPARHVDPTPQACVDWRLARVDVATADAYAAGKNLPLCDPPTDEERHQHEASVSERKRRDDAAAAARIALDVARTDSRCVAKGSAVKCTFKTQEDCTEVNFKLPKEYEQPCPSELPTRVAARACQRF